jgi:glutathione-regulated potassium-efflux system protein KefB
VTLSMAATPILLLIDRLRAARLSKPVAAFEQPPENRGHVIIAGFGRVGQIVARILRAKRIPFTALDINPDQVQLVAKFGNKAFYGDASRPDILDAAQAREARAFVLAIDEVEDSLRTAALVKARYPKLPILARARNRNHAHQLMDLGVEVIRRETFPTALDLSRETLMAVGFKADEAERTVRTFERHDERRLVDAYRHYTDIEKLRELALSDAATLERLFNEDAAEDATAPARKSAATTDGPADISKELTR